MGGLIRLPLMQREVNDGGVCHETEANGSEMKLQLVVLRPALLPLSEPAVL